MIVEDNEDIVTWLLRDSSAAAVSPTFTVFLFQSVPVQQRMRLLKLRVSSYRVGATFNFQALNLIAAFGALAPGVGVYPLVDSPDQAIVAGLGANTTVRLDAIWGLTPDCPEVREEKIIIPQMTNDGGSGFNFSIQCFRPDGNAFAATDTVLTFAEFVFQKIK